MDKNTPLLYDPPHILPPDIVLAPKCEKYGDVLGSPYYIMVGIPPNRLMIDAFPCESIDDEKDGGNSIMSIIQNEGITKGIESRNQWIFSEINIMSSKIRVCSQCFGECTRPHGLNVLPRFGHTLFRIRVVRFAVEEYQRCHTPIESNMSEYEKYIISLPDRTNIRWTPDGEVDEKHCVGPYHGDDMQESLSIALIPDYNLGHYNPDALKQEFRTNFIQDKNRLIPNEQELTRWMKKQINDDRYRIKFCKIFVNPKTREYTYRDDKRVFNTKYTVVVHYSFPEGDWDEYDI